MKKYLNLTNLTLLSVVFVWALSMTSCLPRKEFVYFQRAQMPDSLRIPDSIRYTAPVLRTDDQISIAVSALNPEAVKPFNLYQTTNQIASNYLIDANGMIEFPVLGQLEVAGLTTIEATELLRTKLAQYINNPIVNVRLSNFKFTVLGEVRSPGVYTVSQERLTLPEAIGMARDMDDLGIYKNVRVIREDNGVRTETRVNFTSDSVFKSPVYYVRQNDLIYVEPHNRKINRTQDNLRYWTVTMSTTSFLINLYFIITRNN
ncbi:MAG: polysaccharide biosynthesis/export family protein [Bacteroidota bacterium]|nr:MAG: polysaccharide biosynthesis/export family protein [Bacteroidota bacterium]